MPDETLSNCHLAIASNHHGRMQDRYHPSLGVSLFDSDDGVVRPLYTQPFHVGTGKRLETTNINVCKSIREMHNEVMGSR